MHALSEFDFYRRLLVPLAQRAGNRATDSRYSTLRLNPPWNALAVWWAANTRNTPFLPSTSFFCYFLIEEVYF